MNTFIKAAILSVSVAAISAPVSALPKKVVGGNSHTIVIDGAYDEVFAMGEAGQGNIPGVPADQDQFSPVYTGLHNMKMVDSYAYRTAGIDGDGFLWCFGLDHTGSPLPAPVKVESIGDLIDVTLTYDSMFFVKSNGDMYKWDMDPASAPELMMQDVKYVDGGLNFVIALTNNGDIYTAGDNTYGQLGVGDYNAHSGMVKVDLDSRPAKTISAGKRHVVVVLEDGGVANWGYGYQGLMGIGDRAGVNQPSPVYPNIAGIKDAVASVVATTLLGEDGSIYVYGYHSLQIDTLYNMDRSPRRVQSLSDAEEIFSGHDHFIVKSFDRVYRGWGMATKGRLGAGADVNPIVHVPVVMGGLNSGYVPEPEPTIAFAATEQCSASEPTIEYVEVETVVEKIVEVEKVVEKIVEVEKLVQGGASGNLSCLDQVESSSVNIQDLVAMLAMSTDKKVIKAIESELKRARLDRKALILECRKQFNRAVSDMLANDRILVTNAISW